MSKRKMFFICYIIILPILATLSYFLPRSGLLNFENQKNPFAEEVKDFLHVNENEEPKVKKFKETKIGRYNYFNLSVWEGDKPNKDLINYYVVLDSPKKQNIDKMEGQLIMYSDFADIDGQKVKEKDMKINPKTKEDTPKFTIRHSHKYPFYNGYMYIRRPQLALLLTYEELLDNKTRTIYHMDLIYIDYRYVSSQGEKTF